MSACASSSTTPTGPCARGVGAQLAQHDRVVAAEHERRGARVDHRPQPLVDLAGRPLRVARRDADVAAVDHREGGEDVDRVGGVPGPDEQALVADRGGPEARARAHAGGGVERHAQHRDVGVLPDRVDAGQRANVRIPV